MIKKLKEEKYVAKGDHVVYNGVNYTVINISRKFNTITLRPDTEIYNSDTFEGNSFYDVIITLDELKS